MLHVFHVVCLPWQRFSAVIMRVREPKTTALIFKSGKVVVTGAKSEEQARSAARKYARIIQKVGFDNAKFKDFKIQVPWQFLRAIFCVRPSFSAASPIPQNIAFLTQPHRPSHRILSVHVMSSFLFVSRASCTSTVSTQACVQIQLSSSCAGGRALA